MVNGKQMSRNEVAGFLLGLGIGLIVGLLFSPPSSNHAAAETNNANTLSARSRTFRSRRELAAGAIS
jgi:hypothetical protein